MIPNKSSIKKSITFSNSVVKKKRLYVLPKAKLLDTNLFVICDAHNTLILTITQDKNLIIRHINKRELLKKNICLWVFFFFVIFAKPFSKIDRR